MTLLLGLAIVVAAIVACARRIDVRLALFLAALALGVLAGKPQVIVRTFLITFASEKFLVPICTAMGFAYVLRLTACDRHLVHLLTKPLTRARGLLIPGAIAVGFLVNVPVISQTSTAVAIGSVLLPLLRAAGLSRVTSGAILLLGSSIGGELLNPGAPEVGTIATKTGLEQQAVIDRILPLNLLHLTVATLTFWLLSRRAEPTVPETDKAEDKQEAEAFRVNPIKAFVPVLPLALLFAMGPPLNLIRVPEDWLVKKRSVEDSASKLVKELRKEEQDSYNVRLIGAAMLVGAFAAALTAPAQALQSARSFFEGAGYGFTNIIALIVTANCFGEGVKLIGLEDAVENLIRHLPGILVPLSALMPLGFAVLCGSGMASTQSLYDFFHDSALARGLDPARLGAVVAIASAAGRTMSPVAAVALMCASMTQTQPLELARRVALPLLAGLLAVVVAVMLGLT